MAPGADPTDTPALLKEISERLRMLEISTAKQEGIDAGLALNSRMEQLERRQHDRELHVDHEIDKRPTGVEVAQMIDDAFRRWTFRAVLALIAAAPVWIGLAVAISDRT